MLNKLNVLSLVIVVLSLVGSYILFEQNNRLKQEKTRLETNFTSITSDIKKYKDENGNLVAEIVALKLTKQEIENSKDKEIVGLKKQAEILGIRIKDLEFALATNFKIIVDTVIEPVIVFQNGEKIKMRDTIREGLSYIYRDYDFISNKAKYTINIEGNIYVYYEGMKKQGNWRLINIFVPREKLPILTLSSDNKWLDFNKIKFFTLKKD